MNIEVASQGKQRKIAKSWSGDDILVENCPFKFKVDNKIIVKNAPWAYVQDFPSHISSYLDKLQRYFFQIVVFKLCVPMVL